MLNFTNHALFTNFFFIYIQFAKKSFIPAGENKSIAIY